MRATGVIFNENKSIHLDKILKIHSFRNSMPKYIKSEGTAGEKKNNILFRMPEVTIPTLLINGLVIDMNRHHRDKRQKHTDRQYRKHISEIGVCRHFDIFYHICVGLAPFDDSVLLSFPIFRRNFCESNAHYPVYRLRYSP